MSKTPMNILVVEDDESLRDALIITLEAAGHTLMKIPGIRISVASIACAVK